MKMNIILLMIYGTVTVFTSNAARTENYCKTRNFRI